MHRLAQPGMLLPFKRFFLPYVHHAAGAVLQPRRGETTQHACCSVLWRTRSFVQPFRRRHKRIFASCKAKPHTRRPRCATRSQPQTMPADCATSCCWCSKTYTAQHTSYYTTALLARFVRTSSSTHCSSRHHQALPLPAAPAGACQLQLLQHVAQHVM